MIITKEINIKVNGAHLKHFKSIGLDVKTGDQITIKPEQLSNGSNIRVECKCDVCGEIKTPKYKRYLKSINNGGYYTCSPKCAQEKTKNTFKEKYGVDHHFQTEESKNKIKESFIKNYGATHFSKSEIYKNERVEKIQNKRRETIESKYLEKIDNLVSINDDTFLLFCDEHNGEYEIGKKLFHTRKPCGINPCTICNPINEQVSIKEKEFRNFISDIKEVTPNYRISNKEIDVFVNGMNVGFEFNGLHWHNEKYKENNYHIDKTNFFLNEGIQLIHIYEDDWDNKREIVKSRIRNLLGCVDKKIYARKCNIVELSPKKYKDFINKNHIQGSVNAKIKLGLEYEGKLVSVMSFGKKRKVLGESSEEGVWEMLRFCNKLNTIVVGGASKLFKHFIKIYNPKEVISYADRSWSMGNLYEKLGFEFLYDTKPNYYYIIDKIRFYRYNFRKDKLVSEGFDPNKSEREIMLERGIYRIYDSGSKKYVYRN